LFFYGREYAKRGIFWIEEGDLKIQTASGQFEIGDVTYLVSI